MTANRYRGMIARITRGRGAGQERAIAANTATTLTVSPAWDVVPDASSFFVVAESGWQFGALAKSSPVQFEIPNRAGETVQICGRAANVNDLECAAELSTVTRWQIGGSGASDADVPPLPFFGLGPGQRGGTVELSGVSFTDLTNTQHDFGGDADAVLLGRTARAAELALARQWATDDTSLDLSAQGTAMAGSFVQIEAEVMRVDAVQNSGTRYQVTRGMHTSPAAAHAAQAPSIRCSSKTVIAPFPPDFFGSPYSGSWSYPMSLPDVRVASAELFVTNRRGNSPVRSICLTSDGGPRAADAFRRAVLDSGGRVPGGGGSGWRRRWWWKRRTRCGMCSRCWGRAADAEVRLRVNVDGAAYCTLTFRRA